MQYWRSLPKYQRNHARLYSDDLRTYRNLFAAKRRGKLRQVDQRDLLLRSSQTKTPAWLFARNFKAACRLYGKQPARSNRGWNSHFAVLAECACYLPRTFRSSNQPHSPRPKLMFETTSFLHAKHFPKTYGETWLTHSSIWLQQWVQTEELQRRWSEDLFDRQTLTRADFLRNRLRHWRAFDQDSFLWGIV